MNRKDSPSRGDVDVPSPSFHSALRAHGSSMKPVVVEGNTASSIAMCPCRTRVYARFSNAVGVPKCSVRVTLFDEGERVM